MFLSKGQKQFHIYVCQDIKSSKRHDFETWILQNQEYLKNAVWFDEVKLSLVGIINRHNPEPRSFKNPRTFMNRPPFFHLTVDQMQHLKMFRDPSHRSTWRKTKGTEFSPIDIPFPITHRNLKKTLLWSPKSPDLSQLTFTSAQALCLTSISPKRSQRTAAKNFNSNSKYP